MPRISVVVPVYNVERYLARCLESLRSQTLADIEIVCVNDGATDRSPALLRLAADVDPRIVVVDKPNGGLSSARNAGLAAATGDLVWFVDSDDFVSLDACATLAATFDETGADVVTFGAHIEPASAAYPWLTDTLSPRRVTYTTFDTALLLDEASRPFVWRSAFRREFLLAEGLRFDESVRFGEDQVFAFASYPVSRVTALIPDKLYHYRAARPESLMASRFSARATMMTEHHHITRVILEHWRERGWLAEHRPAMLRWVLDFLATDAVTAEGDLAPTLHASFRELLGEYFPDGPWVDELGPGERALRDVLARGTAATPAARHAALLAWRGTAPDPVSTARKVVRRLRGSAPARGVRSVLRRSLPVADAGATQDARALAEQAATDADLNRATQLLVVEWQDARRA